MPYINDISIDDEDSLGLETKKLNTEAAGNKIDIAVIRLPMISNFTDFLPLELQPEIEVRYITTPAKIGTPDLIIIPGSKNTISDMKFLRESGFETFLKNAGEKNIPLMGICGGYQMLGNTIDDPQGIEGPPQKIKGLELLPIDTILHPEKELAQVSGAFTGNIPFLPEDIKFKGYEIHSGKTATPPETALIKITERSGITCSEPAGTCSGNGLVFGCYIHGFFDIQEVREAFIEWLGHDKGLKSQKIDSSIDKYDKLTDIFQKNIDMERLISVLDLEYIR
jgi:adenosylcobyric acid synthase